MSEYQSLGHQKFRLRYHVIFSTKYRTKCLVGIEEELKEIMHSIAQETPAFKLLEIGVGKDHVHMVIQTKPTTSLHEIIKRIKQLSTWRVWENHSDHMKKFYWKKKKLWTKGYFIATLDEVSESKVLEYVKNQG